MAHGKALIRPPRFKAPRDRHVKVIAVPCPSCRAAAGDPCTRLDGTPSTGHMQHPSRRTMAVRADNLARGIA